MLKFLNMGSQTLLRILEALDSETSGQSKGHLPPYVRLPKSGERCPVSGLSRSHINNLILPNAANHRRPPVRSVSLKTPGAVRGVRLIDVASLVGYIEGQAQADSKGGAPRDD
jgi:hypothetical protein